MRGQRSRIRDLYGSDLERHLFAPSRSRQARTMISVVSWMSAVFALVIWRFLGR